MKKRENEKELWTRSQAAKLLDLAPTQTSCVTLENSLNL